MKKGELELIDYAIYFATKAHTGQKRKSEKNVDMIFHPFTVGMILQRAGANTNCVIAGLLHDVVEDSKYSLEDIEIELNKDVKNMDSNKLAEYIKNTCFEDTYKIFQQSYAQVLKAINVNYIDLPTFEEIKSRF